VNIADGIDAHTRRRRSGNGWRICGERRSHRLRSSSMERFRGQTNAKVVRARADMIRSRKRPVGSGQ
jgi:hypothetical protein